MLNNTAVPVKVNFQPDNPEDINAIKADVYVNGKWKIIGNIQKHKIPKLTVALRQKTVINCRFTKIPKYRINILNSGCNGLMCSLTITNQMKWGPDDFFYRYNKDLKHL